MLTKVISGKKGTGTISLIACAFIYLTILVFRVQDYFIISLNNLLGLLIAPYVFIFHGRTRANYLYLIFSLIFILLYSLNPLTTLLFLGIASAVLFGLESYFGRLNILAPILVISISPIFSFITSYISIPARLKLSSVSASVFSLAGFEASALGNIINLNGHEYSVDQACAGLNMLATSILLGIFVIAYFHRTTGKLLPAVFILAGLALVFTLSIAGNLFRILLLVMFDVSPQDPFHEVFGIICFIVYTLLPSYFILKWIFKRFSKAHSKEDSLSPAPLLTYVNYFLAVTILIVVFLPQRKVTSVDNRLYEKELTSFSVIQHQNGIKQYDKEGILIYVKPISGFYSSEHSPLVCWNGSGYTFKNYSTEKIKGKTVFVGQLQKENDIIHTCWWFDNGTFQTIDQLEWRWKALKGEGDFSLINVNASDKNTLLREAGFILKKGE